jgi:hypothetical protein
MSNIPMQQTRPQVCGTTTTAMIQGGSVKRKHGVISLLLNLRIPQYYSLGYDAHAEPATAADFREWQQHFPYIRYGASALWKHALFRRRVCGRAVSVALPTEQDEAPDERDTSVDPSQGLYLEACVDQASRCDLAVTGSAVQFHSGDRAEAALESQFPRKREREVREQVEFPNTMHDEERIEEVVARCVMNA